MPFKIHMDGIEKLNESCKARATQMAARWNDDWRLLETNHVVENKLN